MSEDKSIPISSDALEAFSRAPAPINFVPDPLPPLEPRSDEEDGEGSPVDPRYPITLLPGFCTRLAGSNCERCTFACAYDAISFDEKGAPQIDTEHCTRCGLCCGLCDAFVTQRITMNDLLEKVGRLSAEGDPVIFTCYDQIPEDFEPHSNVIMLPCIGAVAPEFWAAALEISPNLSVYCNFTLCQDCPTAGPDARELFTHAINLGEQWSHVHMGMAETIPEKTDALTRFFSATSDEYQRRGIATSLASQVEDIASGKHRKRNSESLMNFHARKDSFRATGHASNALHHVHEPSSVDHVVKKEWPRLHMIATAVQAHPDMAPRVPRYLAAVDRELCQHCYEPCFAHCPAGARTIDDEGNIVVDPLLCIACGNCAIYCPYDAAYLFETDGSIFLRESDESAAFDQTEESAALGDTSASTTPIESNETVIPSCDEQ